MIKDLPVIAGILIAVALIGWNIRSEPLRSKPAHPNESAAFPSNTELKAHTERSPYMRSER